MRFKFTLRNHGFTVTAFNNKDIEKLEEFNKRFTSTKTAYNPKTQRSHIIPDKCYVLTMFTPGTFGYHSNLYNQLLTYLEKDITALGDIVVEQIPDYRPAKARLEFKVDEFPLRDKQHLVVSHICSKDGILLRTAVIPMQTGGGKSVSTLYSAYILKVRISLSMSKGYMQSWIDDLAKFFYNDNSQYLIIDSGSKFRKVIEDAKNDKLQNLNIVLFSLDILRTYFKEFEQTGESSYGCLPENLYQLLGVGMRVSDEAHEDIHFQFRHDIHTHVNKSVYLSATIESLDPFTNTLYSILYPRNSRLLGLIWEKYIIGVTLGYSLREPHRAQYTGPKGYSHTKFEKWILNNRTVRDNYFRMILFFMERGFVRQYQPGHKLLVYMSTIKMCDKFTDYIRRNITNKTLRISSFTGTDEALVLLENDVLVSTPLKSGTGRNILGLVAVISTIAIQSIQTNTQTSGRIRQIDKLFPGVEPTFYDLVCTSIPKHMAYYRTKQELFKGQFLRMSTHNTNFEI